MLNLLRKIVANHHTFKFWQYLGLHVVPANFASPIPHTKELDPTLWSKQSETVALNLNEKTQVKLLGRFVSRYRQEYDSLGASDPHTPKFSIDNPYFSSVDAEVLYCFIRQTQPKRVIEIGSGFSTLVTARALLMNHSETGRKTSFIAVDPYPRDFLRNGVSGLSELRTEKVQELPLKFFDQLGNNDVLFIDSTHIAKTGSDVCYEILEIFPRLNKGVIIHIHDIFLPSDYPKKQVLDMSIFYNEQYVLHAFLAFNASFRVLWSGSFMHLRHSAKLVKSFKSYNPQTNWPGSIWLQRIK